MTLIDAMISPAVRGVMLRAVSARRWRVLDPTGRILGHLRADERRDGTRFHAERFDPATGSLRELGAFWSAAEAVDCLRYLR